MISRLLPLLILAFVATSALARSADDDRRELLRVEARLCDAFEKGDANALGRDLDARFTLTSSNGEVSDRASNLAEVVKRDPVYRKFRNHDQNVRLYGDAAIVTGITSLEGSSGGKTFSGDFRFTDTWIREDGQWKLAASHASRSGK